MSRTSSNARSLSYAIEVLGWDMVEKVERWNSHAPRGDGGKGIRQDLFGFIDILAVTGGRIVGIQACGSDAAAHRRKIADEPRAYQWLLSGAYLEMWSWRKVKVKRGGKAKVWAVRRWVAHRRPGSEEIVWEDLR